MTEEVEKKEEKPRDVTLPTGAFHEASIAANRWAVTLPYEHTYEDCFNPKFWSFIARRVSVGDIIDVRTIDQRFYAELYVIESSRIHVSVVELRHFELNNLAGSKQIDLELKPTWKGPSWRWCVIRQTDGEIMTRNLPSQSAAEKWIALNSIATAAA